MLSRCVTRTFLSGETKTAGLVGGALSPQVGAGEAGVGAVKVGEGVRAGEEETEL